MKTKPSKQQQSLLPTLLASTRNNFKLNCKTLYKHIRTALLSVLLIMPLGALTLPAIANDTDQDGVLDIEDIDDDNDGILDVNETGLASGDGGPASVDATQVGTEAYARGNYVQIGVRDNGTFGAVGANAPVDYVSVGARGGSSELLGFIADSGKDGFAGGDFDGDYFTPGTPEEGFSLEINGTNYSNNTASALEEIPGSITGASETDSGNIFWSGAVGGVQVDRQVSVNESNFTIRMETTLTNTTGAALSNICLLYTSPSPRDS